MYPDYVPFESVLGKTFVSIERDGDESITFVVSPAERYSMRYEPDCFAQCDIEDVCGNLEDLIGTPIIRAEQNSNDDAPKNPEYDESYTWTFYRIGTVKGTVVIRWYGSSNGYYSEVPSFTHVVAG